MIVELSAENFALFGNFSITLSRGFNVLTGETGSGKSMLIGAIQLLLGRKSPREFVKDPENDLVVQALFDWEDEDDFVPVVRVFTPRGKSKVYIKGRFSTVDSLRDILEKRVELYSQDSVSYAFTPKGIMSFIDSFVPHNLISRYKTLYSRFVELKKELTVLLEKSENAEKMALEIKSFLEEVESLSPRPGKLDELREKRNILKNRRDLVQVLSEVRDLLSGGSTFSALSRILPRIENLSRKIHHLSDICSMLDTLLSISSDVERKVGEILESLEFSEENLESIEDEFFRLRDLVLRYGSEENIIRETEKKRAELDELSRIGLKVDEVKKEVVKTMELVEELSKELSGKRKKAASYIEAKIAEEMRLLGFSGGRCRFSFSERPLGEDGIDELDLLYSPSKDVPFSSFSKMASGGERSRMALIFKLLSKGKGASTVVLDEVDSGVGGRTSLALGKRLKELGRFCQVLCVTHFPQVASFADRHFLVRKEVSPEGARAFVKEVVGDERVAELSRMAVGEGKEGKELRRIIEGKIQYQKSNP